MDFSLPILPTDSSDSEELYPSLPLFPMEDVTQPMTPTIPLTPTAKRKRELFRNRSYIFFPFFSFLLFPEESSHTRERHCFRGNIESATASTNSRLNASEATDQENDTETGAIQSF